MRLKIRNSIITAPMREILEELHKASDGRFLNIIKTQTGDDIPIQCPWHAEGKESRPSCYVLANDDLPNLTYGTVHCFTCGKSTSLPYLVAKCLGVDINSADSWLITKFGTEDNNPLDRELEQLERELADFKYGDNTRVLLENDFLDESILDKYNFYHPYMFERKLTPEVIRQFKIGYDKEADSITFPIWDYRGRLEAITRRSVSGKMFKLATGTSKSVYLLNFARQNNLHEVYVAESQINALTLYSWGYPAVALLGTGSSHQYDILKKSGIRSFVLCLDPDGAGRTGTRKFYLNLGDSAAITVKDLPNGKDVNDLTKEEFDVCEEMYYSDWEEKYPVLT